MSIGVLFLVLVAAIVVVLCVLGVLFRGSDAELLDLHPERFANEADLESAELEQLLAAESHSPSRRTGENGRQHVDHTGDDPPGRTY